MSPSGGCLRDGMKLRACVSGSVSWTPPRFQLILQIQPTLRFDTGDQQNDGKMCKKKKWRLKCCSSGRRSEVMALQNYLCAGCGTEVEPSEWGKNKIQILVCRLTLLYLL